MKFEHIVGYHNLWMYLGEVVEDIELNTTMIMQAHHFALKSGEAVYTNSYNHTLDILNERFGTQFCSDLSTFVGQTHFTLAIKEDGETVKPEVVEDVVPESVEEHEVELAQDVDVVEVSTEVVTEEKQPDWAWIDTLGTDADSKKELDVYAENEWGVKLSRTMKFENMVKKFKEELEKR